LRRRRSGEAKGSKSKFQFQIQIPNSKLQGRLKTQGSKFNGIPDDILRAIQALEFES
jgi:hypothetical protein